jgi:hypothetical protein
LEDVGFFFYFTKSKWQTIGDTRLFHLPKHKIWQMQFDKPLEMLLRKKNQFLAHKERNAKNIY